MENQSARSAVKRCASAWNRIIRKSLQAGTKRSTAGGRSVSLRRRRRCCLTGSLTVEAAVTVPVFLLCFAMLVGMLDIYRIQSLVKVSLHESAMELGMYMYAADVGAGSSAGAVGAAAGAAYAKAKLPDLGDNVTVSLVTSRCTTEEVDLVAQIRYRLPVTFFPVPAIRLTNESKVHCWVGGTVTAGDGTSGSDAGNMVYVTDYESVYHTHADCTHLDLAIHSGPVRSVEKKRNQYGSKYKACEKCGGGTADSVYYTEKGDRYHSDPACSGLTRSVHLVEAADVEHLSECSRCKGKDGS